MKAILTRTIMAVALAASLAPAVAIAAPPPPPIRHAVYWYTDASMTTLAGYVIEYCDGTFAHGGIPYYWENEYFGDCGD